jgi:hypothetical protein
MEAGELWLRVDQVRPCSTDRIRLSYGGIAYSKDDATPAKLAAAAADSVLTTMTAR